MAKARPPHTEPRRGVVGHSNCPNCGEGVKRKTNPNKSKGHADPVQAYVCDTCGWYSTHGVEA